MKRRPWFWVGCLVLLAFAYLLTRLVTNEYVFFAGEVVLQFIALATAWNIAGGYAGWRDGGLRVNATPHDPADVDCIDFLFFTHGRHDGNADAAREYLAWETGLLDQLDAQERGSFQVATSL